MKLGKILHIDFYLEPKEKTLLIWKACLNIIIFLNLIFLFSQLFRFSNTQVFNLFWKCELFSFLKKVTKLCKEFPCSPHPDISDVSILRNHGLCTTIYDQWALFPLQMLLTVLMTFHSTVFLLSLWMLLLRLPCWLLSNPFTSWCSSGFHPCSSSL